MKHVGSLDESCVSAFDESLMNRPTEELFEQVRANRPKHRGDAVRSSDLQLHDLEASHNRRMEELNRIALDQLGNRISNLDHDRLSSCYQPDGSIGQFVRDEEKVNEVQRCSTDIVGEYKKRNQREMERLRRKIHQLEQECLESGASVPTPKKMGLSELDGNDERQKSAGRCKIQHFNGAQSFHGDQSFDPQSSFISMEDLSSSTLSLSQVKLDKRGPTRALHDQVEL
ncbi:uncharacterized protein KRP23_11040 [Phytophthora ramorum]|uniref:uncharacterized protein n=1 Tax=Phytophthora ramorum TaxID=164328 RepID=UPI0030A6682A|nr:hypothetical protein KRP23_11040 [Phytophthora ramorum]